MGYQPVVGRYHFPNRAGLAKTGTSSMKIILSCINYAPEHAATANYSTDSSLFFIEQGHQVNVVTAFPYYPQWKKRKQDKGRLFQREQYQNAEVFRGYLYVPENVTTLKRLWHELTFSLFAFLNFLRAGRPDAIIIFIPPFSIGVIGVLAKLLWKRPLIINIQDLPLDAALALGMIKPGLFTRIIQKIENWVYRNADLVTTISPAMMDNVRSKGVAQDNLVLVPNWIDLRNYEVAIEKDKFISKYPDQKTKFTIAYAGNFGKKQGLDILLHLAKQLESEQSIHIFIIGDGADKPRLLNLADEMNLANVTFLPFLSQDEYKEMLEDIDLVFIAQRNEAGNNFFPSKLLGLMAQGKPVLVSADIDSELARVIQEAGCGLVSPYGDIPALASNVKQILASPQKLSSMGEKGREAVKSFDRQVVLEDWHEAIKKIVRQS
jgi:colanic acid biosynthesis glycosyl transferase WcaI